MTTQIYNQDLYNLLVRWSELEPSYCQPKIAWIPPEEQGVNIGVMTSPGIWRRLYFGEPLEDSGYAAIEYSVLEAIASKTGWEVEICSSPLWKVNVWKNRDSGSSTNTEALRDNRSHALLEAYVNTLEAVNEAPSEAASLLKIVNKFLPELTLNATEDWARWSWSYRCVESEEERPDGFSSPLEALIHFAGKQSDLLDKIMSWKPTHLDEARENLSKAQQVFKNG